MTGVQTCALPIFSARDVSPRAEPTVVTPHRLRSYRGLVRGAIAAGVILVLGLLGWWQSDAVGRAASGIMALVRGTPGTPVPREPSTVTTIKNPDRIGQPNAVPSVAQRVVLYEEDPNDPQGKRYVGTAVWRTEMTPASPGRSPELVVRGDVNIPDRHMTMTLSFRRNSDKTLPASHTIEISFNLPQEPETGAVKKVPGVLMKQAEATRGVPLAGLAIEVSPGFFLIGLSSVESDMLRNVQLLKERSWFDIPIVYGNNRRAILALEKGTPGEQAFNDAVAAWRQ